MDKKLQLGKMKKNPMTDSDNDSHRSENTLNIAALHIWKRLMVSFMLFRRNHFLNPGTTEIGETSYSF